MLRERKATEELTKKLEKEELFTLNVCEKHKVEMEVFFKAQTNSFQQPSMKPFWIKHNNLMNLAQDRMNKRQLKWVSKLFDQEQQWNIRFVENFGSITSADKLKWMRNAKQNFIDEKNKEETALFVFIVLHKMGKESNRGGNGWE